MLPKTIHIIENLRDNDLTIKAYTGTDVLTYSISRDVTLLADDLATLITNHFKEDQ